MAFQEHDGWRIDADKVRPWLTGHFKMPNHTADAYMSVFLYCKTAVFKDKFGEHVKPSPLDIKSDYSQYVHTGNWPRYVLEYYLRQTQPKTRSEITPAK